MKEGVLHRSYVARGRGCCMKEEVLHRGYVERGCVAWGNAAQGNAA